MDKLSYIFSFIFILKYFLGKIIQNKNMIFTHYYFIISKLWNYVKKIIHCVFKSQNILNTWNPVPWICLTSLV